MKNPYRVLGLGHDASTEEIAGAYRKLVRRYPPELNARRFAQIHLAHEQLTSPDRGMDEALERPKDALEALFPLPEIRLCPPPQPPTRPSLEDLSPLLQPQRRVLLRELLRDAGWASQKAE